jgi:hypothetical protein
LKHGEFPGKGGVRDRWCERLGESLTDPDLVGEMVVNGIRNDELYIFNDPVSRTMFEKRMNKMYEAFDRQFPGSK